MLGNALGAFYTMGATSQAALSARTSTQPPQAAAPQQTPQTPAAAAPTSTPEVPAEKPVEASRATAESRFRSFLDGLIEADASRMVSGMSTGEAQNVPSQAAGGAQGQFNSPPAPTDRPERSPTSAKSTPAQPPVADEGSNAAQSREYARSEAQEQTQLQAQARSAYAQAASPTRIF